MNTDFSIKTQGEFKNHRKSRSGRPVLRSSTAEGGSNEADRRRAEIRLLTSAATVLELTQDFRAKENKSRVNGVRAL
jgi:hypothetical protein